MKTILISILILASAAGAKAGTAMDQLLGMAATSAPLAIKGHVVSFPATTGAVEWVDLNGGVFLMGTDDGYSDALPVHQVEINSFKMSKTDVTVGQYAECVRHGKCTLPNSGPLEPSNCNWNLPGRENYPVNCVSWHQAKQYAEFAGARLPTEAEWEYAATSGGKNRKYPWGNTPPTDNLAVMNTNAVMPVCSKPDGNTEQGLCDMAGNVWQWVEDAYGPYTAAVTHNATSGSEGISRVVRGGSCSYTNFGGLRSDYRNRHLPGIASIIIGFRIAK